MAKLLTEHMSAILYPLLFFIHHFSFLIPHDFLISCVDAVLVLKVAHQYEDVLNMELIVEVPFLPFDKAVASRAVFAFPGRTDERPETLFVEPAK